MSKTWKSTYEPVEVGGTTLDRLVLAAAERAGARTALIDGETAEPVSYTELAARIAAVAATLDGRGARRGDVLALWAPNCPAWPAVAFGAMAAGMTVTAASPACTERELAGQLADSRAALIATTPDRMAAAESAAKAAAGSAARVSPASAAPVSAASAAAVAPAVVSLGDLVDGVSRRGPAAVSLSRPDDLALLPYSSGTTGLPKGVMLTHVNLVTAVRQVHAAIRPTERDTCWRSRRSSTCSASRSRSRAGSPPAPGW